MPRCTSAASLAVEPAAPVTADAILAPGINAVVSEPKSASKAAISAVSASVQLLPPISAIPAEFLGLVFLTSILCVVSD